MSLSDYIPKFTFSDVVEGIGEGGAAFSHVRLIVVFIVGVLAIFTVSAIARRVFLRNRDERAATNLAQVVRFALWLGLLGFVTNDLITDAQTRSFLGAILTGNLVQAVVIGGIGFTVIGFLGRTIRRTIAKSGEEHNAMFVSRAIQGALYAGLLIVLLNQFDIQLGALLGAAGIFSLAIGFAAQSGLSNLISGLFLYFEKPFKVGDLITSSGTTGVVMSIDMTSTKLRRLDHVFVRIPNENLVKSTVENITRFPIRRMDLNIGISYNDDPRKVIDVLKEVALHNRYALDNPEPLVLFQEFGDSSLNFLFGVWFEKSNYVALRNSILCDIKERFDKDGIEIPFPHQTLYTGASTQPFPVRVISTAIEAPAETSKPAPAAASAATPPA